MDCMGESIDFLWDFILGILLSACCAFVVVRCSMWEFVGYCYFFVVVGDTVVGMDWRGIYTVFRKRRG